MADIFREVDEELSRDRAMQAWRKHGKYVIAFAIAAVIAVAGFSGWQDYRERQRQAEGRAYVQAIDLVMKEDLRAATAAMAEVASKGGGYRPLALLEEASLKVKAGDRAGALKIYDDLAADGSIGRPFRDLATILSVMISLDTGEPAALAEEASAFGGAGSGLPPLGAGAAGPAGAAPGRFQNGQAEFPQPVRRCGRPHGSAPARNSDTRLDR